MHKHKHQLSLKRRVFIRLLVITVAAVLVFYSIGLYLNASAVDTVRSDLQKAMDKETSYIASQINRDVSNLTTQCQELASDKGLLRYVIVNSTMSDYQRVAGVTRLYNELLRIKFFSDLVEKAEILLPQIERMVVTDADIYNTMDQEEWSALSAALGQRSQQITEHRSSAYLLCTKAAREGPRFIISVCISPERLLQRTLAMSSDETLELVLLRADGTPFVGTEEGIRLLQTQPSSNGRFLHEQDEYFVSAAEIPMLSLQLVCFSPTGDALQPMLQHRAWFWVLTLMTAALLMGYLAYYRFYILQPLNTIADSVRQAEETGHFHIDQSHGDFDDLYAQFNGMVEHIEVLAAQVYEERFRAQQSEIRQLQMQINPHFFYNTLFLLYRMAQAEGSDEIAQLSLNLSNYYRYITKLPEHDVPLRDEVKHISNYLEIQGFRFAPRVTVHLDSLPEEIAGEHIPPLILQPIVENAFVHGVKNKVSGGTVQMSFSYDEQRFGVTVYDNGGEMDEETVRSLDERMRAGQLHEGSALYNLYRRMELCYGTKYELRLESQDQGLRVSILFPRTGR